MSVPPEHTHTARTQHAHLQSSSSSSSSPFSLWNQPAAQFACNITHRVIKLCNHCWETFIAAEPVLACQITPSNYVKGLKRSFLCSYSTPLLNHSNFTSQYLPHQATVPSKKPPSQLPFCCENCANCCCCCWRDECGCSSNSRGVSPVRAEPEQHCNVLSLVHSGLSLNTWSLVPNSIQSRSNLRCLFMDLPTWCLFFNQLFLRQIHYIHNNQNWIAAKISGEHPLQLKLIDAMSSFCRTICTIIHIMCFKEMSSQLLLLHFVALLTHEVQNQSGEMQRGTKPPTPHPPDTPPTHKLTPPPHSQLPDSRNVEYLWRGRDPVFLPLFFFTFDLACYAPSMYD